MCKYKRSLLIGDIVDFVNENKITKDMIVNVFYKSDSHEYVLVYFT